MDDLVIQSDWVKKCFEENSVPYDELDDETVRHVLEEQWHYYADDLRKALPDILRYTSQLLNDKALSWDAASVVEMALDILNVRTLDCRNDLTGVRLRNIDKVKARRNFEIITSLPADCQVVLRQWVKALCQSRPDHVSDEEEEELKTWWSGVPYGKLGR